MFERLKRIVAVWNDRAEIMALTQRDLDEIGLTRDQLLHLSSLPPGLADRVGAMAAIFGVRPQALQYPRADYVQVLDTCKQCGALKRCEAVLADHDATQADCGFCPNAPAFAAA